MSKLGRIVVGVVAFVVLAVGGLVFISQGYEPTPTPIEKVLPDGQFPK